MSNRISTSTYAANYPIEDRHAYHDLKHVDGFVVTVFDGHGGFQCSEWAKCSLHAYLDDEFRKIDNRTPSDEQVKKALNSAFNRVEREFVRVAKIAYDINFSTVCQTGSCCLCALIINNKLYVANIGDCRGVLFQKAEEGEQYVSIKVNTKHSADSPKEQQRLRKQFPEDKDIVKKAYR